MKQDQSTPHYVIQRIRETLAHDPRVGELELQVNMRAGKVFLTGTVASEPRRRAISEVMEERFPDLEVHNQTTVPELGSGGDVETVQ